MIVLIRQITQKLSETEITLIYYYLPCYSFIMKTIGGKFFFNDFDMKEKI